LFTNACLLALTPKERQFIQEHRLPLAAEQILNSKYPSITPGETYNLGEYGVFIAKRGIDRIVGANYLKDFIQQADIKHIKVANKYLYHIPGKHDTLSDNNYFILARAIELLSSDKQQPLSLEAITEMAAVIRLAHYTDIFGNIIMSGIDELTLIDTENSSFAPIHEATAFNSIPFQKNPEAEQYLKDGALLAPQFEKLRNYPALERRSFNITDQYELTPQLQEYVRKNARRPNNVYDALLHALIQNDVNTLKQFVTSGIDLNQLGNYKYFNIYPLAAAIRMLNVSLADYLIENGALIKKLTHADNLILNRLKGQNISFRDVLINDEPIISYYAHGADIFDKIIPFLLRAGANSNQVTSKHSPLYRAVSLGDAQLVELLLSSGADVERSVPQNKNNLLSVAVEFQQPIIIPILLNTNKYSFEQIVQALEQSRGELSNSFDLPRSREVINGLLQALVPKI